MTTGSGREKKTPTRTPTLGLVFPFKLELECFVGDESGWETVSNTPTRIWRNAQEPDWLLAEGGQGKVETALTCEMLHTSWSTERFFLVGSAAALQPDLAVGDFVIGTKCIEWDFGLGSPGNPDSRPVFRPDTTIMQGLQSWSEKTQSHPIHRGPILSGDRDVFNPRTKEELYARHGGLCVAWEGAGFHRFLRRRRLPGLELRCISETLTESVLDFDIFKERIRAQFPDLRHLVRSLSGLLA